jgi:glycosyltransferase involved in cell wall biosynthesis
MPTDRGNTHILFLGNPSRRKGLHDLIAALAIAPLRSLEWRLSVAGGGAEIETFRDMSRAAAIADRVSFLGWVDRATTTCLLDAADILVLPSYAEGMAMSVLEAMSHGLCIVCTPVGSLQDVVENETSALVVQPGEINALARALARAVTDPALRVRLGSAAARAFANKFDVAHYPGQIRPVYQAAFSAAPRVLPTAITGSGGPDQTGKSLPKP